MWLGVLKVLENRPGAGNEEEGEIPEGRGKERSATDEMIE